MSLSNKKCVGIIFGGNSNEHLVSINSAKAIFDAFNSKSNKEKYVIKVFYINKRGIWFSCFESLLLLTGKRNFEEYQTENKSNMISLLLKEDFNQIDAWFPVLHGLNGEDGTIQGLLKLTQKPFVSSGVLGSALGMDKIAMKLIFSQLKIPQVNYLPIDSYNLNDKFNLKKICAKIIERFKFPIFVKPSNSGSSLGISKVNNSSEISAALLKAFRIDNRIVVEEGLKVRELECGIIGKSNLITSEVGEINYSADWYDYKTKYSEKNNIIIPAQIDQEVKEKIHNFALQACKALNIDIFARADFFLVKDSNKVYLNEINTIPGFTDKSMFPLLWKASGLEIDQLVAKLIEISFES